LPIPFTPLLATADGDRKEGVGTGTVTDEYEGVEPVGDREAHGIATRTEDGEVLQRIYLDTEWFLPLKVWAKRTVDGNGAESVYRLADVEFNPAIEEEQFTFEVPPNATVDRIDGIGFDSDYCDCFPVRPHDSVQSIPERLTVISMRLTTRARTSSPSPGPSGVRKARTSPLSAAVVSEKHPECEGDAEREQGSVDAAGGEVEGVNAGVRRRWTRTPAPKATAAHGRVTVPTTPPTRTYATVATVPSTSEPSTSTAGDCSRKRYQSTWVTTKPSPTASATAAPTAAPRRSIPAQTAGRTISYR